MAADKLLHGQADDLGGGVYKKRLNRNDHRAIVIMKGRDFIVFEYLFAKKDRDNIDEPELKAFRALAKIYATLTLQQVEKLVTEQEWYELIEGNSK